MKKRRSSQVLSCIIALILILSMVPVVNVSAVTTNIAEVAGTTTSGLEYEISGGEVTITDYTGSATTCTIPSQIEGYPVTRIDVQAFYYCTSLTSITIPSSVTSIGNYAFYNCTSLKSVTIPEGVTSIGFSAFEDCTSLTSITIPSSVTSIGDSAFYYCPSLTSITIPEGVTSIGDGVFSYCTSLTSITIPSSVTSIGNNAFLGCKSLTSITIPSSITSIGEWAFYHCESLTSITIPSSVTSIGKGAFSGCKSLTSITIPSHVKSIGESAFLNCESLTSITIPSSVTSITDNMFYYCTNLTSIIIPSSVTSIGNGAFYNCRMLNDVYYRGTQAQWNAIEIGGDNEYLLDAEIHYNYVDSTKPTVSINSTNLVASSQTATLSLSDNVGVVSYYWGTSSSPSSSSFTTISSTTSTSIQKAVSSSGTYYLIAKDADGNVSTSATITFYKTTLNANGGSVSPTSVITKSGNSFTAPTPTRFGYNFKGWSTSSTATSGSTTITPTSNTTYYAVWQAPTTLSVNSTNTASISSGGEMKYYSYTPSTSGKYVIYSTATVDTKVYLYDSDGIELDSDDDGGDSTNFRLEYNLTAGEKYYFGVRYYNSSNTGSIPFKFGRVYTITYNANGGSGAPPTQYKDYGTSITLSTEKPTKSNYTFAGWATSSTATSASYQPGDTYSTESNRTLYAVWTPVDTTKPTVSISSTNLVASSQTVTLSMSDNVGVVSYYWGTSSSPSSSSYTTITSTKSISIQKTVSSSGTYYLIAKDAAGNVSSTASITYYKTILNANGGSVSPTSVLTKSGNSFTPSAPTRFGYNFKGWSTASTATSGSTTITPTSNTTYYAIWQSAYILSDGSTNTADVSVGGEMRYYSFTPSTSGKYVIYSTGSGDPMVTLYNSSGNMLSSDDEDGENNNFRLEYSLTAGTKYYFGVEFYSSSKTGSIPFKFGRVYTITYNANGGSGAPPTQYKDYGILVALSTQEPTKSNYTFAGWATSSTASSASYQPGDTYSTESNLTLYAVWTYEDTTKPTVSISTTNLATSSQTVTLSMSDNVGVVSYYWGTSSSPSSSSFTTISSTTSTSIQKTVSSSGTYYLIAKDAAGNVSSTASITYYKTTLNANGGTVSPTSVLTKSGETVILPTPTRTNYGFAGWGTTSTATSGINALTVYENRTYYAIWSDKDTKNPTVSVRSTNDVASSQTATLVMSDNIGVVSYYWGKSASPSSSAFISIASATSKSVDVRVYENGTYYLIAKDAEGNSSITAATFYTTTLNANGGTVSPSSILTKSGNTVTLPTPVRNSYKYLGWNVSSTATSGSLSVSVTSSRTYYAVWEYIHTCSFTGEEEIVIEATCTENGSKIVHCNEPSCSKVQTVVIEAYGHGEGVWEVVKPVACLENGLKERRCPDCDYLFESEIIYSTGHSMGEWYVYINPGFHTQGEERKDCANCDYFDYRFIPATSVGHQCDFTGEEEIVFAATCTESGSKKIYCFEPECGEYILETIESFGHSLGDWQVYKAAKFHEEGEERKTCEHCSYFEYRPIPKTSIGHKCKFTGKEEFIDRATCLNDGRKKVFCFEPECGKYKEVEVKRTGHNISDWTVYTEVQFHIDGEERKTCANCGFYESRVIPKLSESHTCSFTGRVNVVFEPTCTETGLKKTYCIEPECGKYLTETPEALGHTESEFTVVKDATCTEDGTKQQKCTVCDEILKTEVITAYGHEYNDWTVIKEATDTEAGEKTRECLICHYVESEIIDPLIPPTTTPDEEKTDLGLLGDVNGDGKVNIKDATMIQKAAAKITALSDDEKLRADVNADTKNNVKDATAIQKYVAKIETGFPIGEAITVKNPE